jgi:hypothetical protein
MSSNSSFLKWIGFIFVASCFLAIDPAWAASCIYTSANEKADSLQDPISRLIARSDKCPVDVFQFRELLKKSGLKLEPTMVANRGFHNPSLGSFSIFEIASGPDVDRGDFFFGHFTGIQDDHLIADQSAELNSLMIEAIAWDPSKKLYHFYELRGDGTQGKWFYRGDSADIYADNQPLYLQADPAHPKFGKRLRCAACHGAGGPIMKELDSPQNDWWEPTRKLDFDGRTPNDALRSIMEDLVPAERLTESVVAGIRKLSSERSVAELSLQEQLRPLFCPTEINFQSDVLPNDEAADVIHVPSAFVIDTMLYEHTEGMTISRKDYEFALHASHSKFPEIDREDADHAWLTPVRARSDQMMAGQLIKRKVIDDKFAAAVLSVDMTNPLFSKTRCELLRYVPKTETSDWLQIFLRNLKNSENKSAHELFLKVTDAGMTKEYFENNAKLFLEKCQVQLRNKDNVIKMHKLLAQRRVEVAASELSANVLGRILEPGFRVIFPEVTPKPVAGNFKLDENCNVI